MLGQGSVSPNQLKRTSKLKNGDKNWNHKCGNCGQVPTVHPTGLCGPCCFGEADTVDGNW